MGNAICKIEDCDDPVAAQGWCGFHYGRWHRLGDPLAGPPRRRRRTPRPTAGAAPQICAVEPCDDPVKAAGWCSFHYYRDKQYGDPLGGPPRRARKGQSKPECKAPDCGEPARTLGWCKRHYQKHYKTGDALSPDKYTRRGAPLEERLEARIFKTDYCWFWTGRPTAGGYGQIGIIGENGRKLYQAHRVVYETWVRPIPDGLELDHLCRNRACVRPDHLEPVSHIENVRRGASMDRATHCKNGHEYTPENTYWKQTCITCGKAATARWKARVRKARKKAALAIRLSAKSPRGKLRGLFRSFRRPGDHRAAFSRSGSIKGNARLSRRIRLRGHRGNRPRQRVLGEDQALHQPGRVPEGSGSSRRRQDEREHERLPVRADGRRGFPGGARRRVDHRLEP